MHLRIASAPVRLLLALADRGVTSPFRRLSPDIRFGLARETNLPVFRRLRRQFRSLSLPGALLGQQVICGRA